MTRRCFTLLVAGLLLSGCQQQLGPPKLPQTYPVRGKLLLDGKLPPPCGVRLVQLKKKLALGASGDVAKDGTFSLSAFAGQEGVAPGHYVLIVQPAPTPPPGATGKTEKPAPKKKEKPPPPIPAKYQEPETSPFEVEIKEGDNDLGTLKMESDHPAGPAKKK